MLTRRALALARLRGWAPTTPRGWALFALAALYAAAVLVAAVWSADVGAGLVFATNAGCLGLGGRDFLTLAGRLHWRRYGPWARVGLVCCYLAGWVMSPAWLGLVADDALRTRRAEMAARPARIAALERELGLAHPPDPPPA